MEPIYLIFLLVLLGKDSSQLKESLNAALKFYRENRELLTMLSGMTKREPPSAPPEEKPREQEKSRPEEVGQDKIIEEFLKTHAL